ncbi:MAG: MetQ/NlpA family ABC transporter substrate-binding protein, partial [Oscillospiraceae bacterium]
MKKLFVGLLTLSLCLFAFTGCFENSQEVSSQTEQSSSEMVTLKVGASPSPHSEILEQVKEKLKEQNINLEIIEFTDYVLPNLALSNGEIDANYFQHKPYLEKFNKENGTNIVGVAEIHFEPLGIYPGKSADLDNIPNNAVIAVPNDATNEARSLLLLESLGIIKLKKNVGLNATSIDIIESPKNIKVFEIEAAQLTETLKDVDFAIINGNYAVDAKIVDTVLKTEDKDGDACKTYSNLICTTDENKDNDLVKSLV